MPAGGEGFWFLFFTFFRWMTVMCLWRQAFPSPLPLVSFLPFGYDLRRGRGFVPMRVEVLVAVAVGASFPCMCSWAKTS